MSTPDSTLLGDSPLGSGPTAPEGGGTNLDKSEIMPSSRAWSFFHSCPVSPAFPHGHPRPLAAYDLCAQYTKKIIFKSLSFELQSSESLSILGPNGAGKTTLVSLMAGLLPSCGGSWGWQDVESSHSKSSHGGPSWIRSAPTEQISAQPNLLGDQTSPQAGLKSRLSLPKPGEIGFLPQRFTGQRTFPISVRHTLRLTALAEYKRHHTQWWLPPHIRQALDHQVDKTLKRLWLTDLAKMPVGSLSGGQFQRLLLARLCLQTAPLILLDEPFAGLDDGGVHLILDLITTWRQQGRIILVTQHNRDRALDHFPKSLLLGGPHTTPIFGPSAQVLRQEIWDQVHQTRSHLECQ